MCGMETSAQKTFSVCTEKVDKSVSLLSPTVMSLGQMAMLRAADKWMKDNLDFFSCNIYTESYEYFIATAK